MGTLIESLNIPRVDFLKIEAEGYEPEILEGATEVLHCVRKIAVDASPERRGKSTLSECRAILERAGFNVYERNWMLFGSRK